MNSTPNGDFVIATLNCAEELSITLSALCSQVVPGDRILVQDGASSDHTAKVARKFSGLGYPVFVYVSPDKGIYQAWNRVLARVENQWVAFIGAGDVVSTKYRKQVSRKLNSTLETGVNFISFKAVYYDSRHEAQERSYLRVIGKPFDKEQIVFQMKVCHPGALHHSSLFENHIFSQKYRIVSDYQFLLRNRFTIKPEFIDAVLIELDYHGVSNKYLSPILEEYKMKRGLALKPKATLFLEGGYKLVKSLFFKFVDAQILIKRRYIENQDS